ncbi:MAG TPA: ornithine carbamoyltransferase [Marmoricola sp.]|nr:ornithine carbamoyltransferase [Marmoricola sp.]HNI69938.1 ornithine carbamoyltransferase [Marmoricola sp.]HNN47465.1 ornithine carbamoyltransferase [Marmoricola sp.]HNO38871.1 ornithine carbamoyltransferase [Marmoricola sp.]
MIRHFLRDDDLSPEEHNQIIERALSLKAAPYSDKCLSGPRSVAMIFDKPTLRTQASFSVAISDLGGAPMLVDGQLAQIGIRESIADTARVLGRMTSAIVWRTGDQSRIQEMAEYAGVPVINALTDQFHPCQGIADLLTIREHKGGLAGLALAMVGDAASNMSHTYLLSGALAGMQVRLSGPPGYEPAPEVLERASEIAAQTGGSVKFTHDPNEAVAGADAVATDTWVSMGKEAEAEQRLDQFAAWQLNSQLLEQADSDAIVLHCLPAYRGKEITAEVIDGPRSVVFDEAENRLHAQKAVISFLMEQS